MKSYGLFPWLGILLCGLFAGLTSTPCMGELGKDDLKRLTAVNDMVNRAGTEFSAGNYAACGETLNKAQDQLVEAVRRGGPEVREKAEAIHGRMRRAGALLELEGVRFKAVDLAAIESGEAMPSESKKPEPSDTPKKPTPTPTPKPAPKPAPPAPTPTDGVSFVKDVAPILVGQCARCHIAGNRGNFSMATYAALMKGPPEGVVVFPGDVAASRLIETMETGDMPRGGGRVPQAQIDLLKKWIMAGAKFDGPNPEANLTSLVKPGEAPTPPPTEPRKVQASTGKETVSFSRQVAPLLVENCNGCHIDAMQTRGGLRMDNLAQLMRGGDSGEVVNPGDGDGSLLIKKLRGQAGDRMPAGGRPALSDENIQLIATWIQEGATLDAGSAEQPLRVLAAQAWAKHASPEELSARRMDLAKKNWKLGSPNAAMEVRESDHFVVIGDIGPSTLDLVSTTAEGLVKEVTAVTKPVGRDEPFRGRVTIYVFPKRYTYSEFGKMIESRALPGEWTGHWQFDGIDAYVALVVTSDETPERLRSRLHGLLTSQAVAQFGDVPRWISEGIGRMTMARVGGKQGPGAAWDAALAQALSDIEKPEQFLEGKLPPEQTDIVGYGIAKFMYAQANRRGTDRMLRSLIEGKPLKEALAAGYNATPQEFVLAYANWQRLQWRGKR